MFQISTAVDTALELDTQCTSKGPSSERKHNRHCTKSLDSGKKSISKLGLLLAYMIKNDKVLSFIFIKRQKAEQNNLLLSSARFICLAKPGGGQKGGWKAQWPNQVPPFPQTCPSAGVSWPCGGDVCGCVSEYIS